MKLPTRRPLGPTRPAEPTRGHRPRSILTAATTACGLVLLAGSTVGVVRAEGVVGAESTAGGGTGPVVSGYIQTQLKVPVDTNGDGEAAPGRFRVQRARITVKGDVDRHISYEMDIDPRPPEITGFLRDAYFTIKDVVPHHRIRVGQQKTQFGYENLVSSSRLYFVNRTDVSDNLSRGMNLRDLGVSVLGKYRIGRGYRVDSAISFVNGAGMNVQEDNNDQKNVWGRLGLRKKTDALTWRLGASYGNGDVFDEGDDPEDPADDFFLDFARIGGDVELEMPRLEINAEYVQSKEKALGEEDDVTGYYVTLIGKTRWKAGPAFRYENVNDEFKRTILGAYFGESDAAFRVLVNYEFRTVEEDPDFPNGEDDRFYTWAQVRF